MTEAAPAIVGVVVPGDGRGRLLGFPTANLCCEDAVIPADGIYAAWVTEPERGLRWEATASVGTNPTFAGARRRRLEVHLHDADLDLYGRRLVVDLVAFLRPTLQFEGADQLVAQAVDDVRRSRQVLSMHRRAP
ncbi:riboflavin kinase [Microbacterium resistens]|uniref:riboflavin kinase n=1 Tax=Microbacterium resistens TaxID=156977 RepID=A0ABY3RQI8_9MICO|nr:riboflavin kinase [Microbacterium resistens]UGS25140.1 riboflavin kinase [Microbacterium resistens]